MIPTKISYDMISSMVSIIDPGTVDAKFQVKNLQLLIAIDEVLTAIQREELHLRLCILERSLHLAK